MHDHTPRRCAALAGRAYRAEKDRLRRHIDVRARRDDERVVAAEFHDRPTQTAMNSFRNIQAHVYRTRSRD